MPAPGAGYVHAGTGTALSPAATLSFCGSESPSTARGIPGTEQTYGVSSELEPG